MKVVFIALNSKYSDSNLALRYLLRSTPRDLAETELIELTVNVRCRRF